MSADFYRAFEDKFRGTREIIKSRLEVYLPFVMPLKDIYPDSPSVDLGCGRGEWLELLTENGFSVQGIDIDDSMLAACREHGLEVQTGEAITFLRGLSDNSQIVISGFHIAEHIPFEDLQTLVKESLRVLKPAGLLILETPNPENIVVGTSSFYLDPTHSKPIPPQLLAFVSEFHGFNKNKILRLQETNEVTNSNNLSLLNVLSGVSPDYAVVAQKNAKTELLDVNEDAFKVEYGVTLETLAIVYNQQAEARENKIQQLHTELLSVYTSRSWRITSPLRWFLYQIRLLQQHGIFSRIKVLIKKIARRIALRGIAFIDNHPSFRRLCVILPKKLGLYDRIHPIYLRISGRAGITQKAYLIPGIPYLPPKSINDLSLNAQHIYAELIASSVEDRKENADANRY